MLKRRLTLIFKVDNPLRMTRHAISGCDEIMRDFNILRRDRRQKQNSASADRFFCLEENRRARNGGIAAIANNVLMKIRARWC
jgi:hypothetical protein